MAIAKTASWPSRIIPVAPAAIAVTAAPSAIHIRYAPGTTISASASTPAATIQAHHGHPQDAAHPGYSAGRTAALASSAIPAIVPTSPLVSIGISTSREFGEAPICVIASTYFCATK